MNWHQELLEKELAGLKEEPFLASMIKTKFSHQDFFQQFSKSLHGIQEDYPQVQKIILPFLADRWPVAGLNHLEMKVLLEELFIQIEGYEGSPDHPLGHDDPLAYDNYHFIRNLLVACEKVATHQTCKDVNNDFTVIQNELSSLRIRYRHTFDVFEKKCKTHFVIKPNREYFTYELLKLVSSPWKY